jgi:hypothetical protein
MLVEATKAKLSRIAIARIGGFDPVRVKRILSDAGDSSALDIDDGASHADRRGEVVRRVGGAARDERSSGGEASISGGRRRRRRSRTVKCEGSSG